MMRKHGILLLICLICLGMLAGICWAVTAQQRDLSQLQFQAQGVSLSLYRDQDNDTYYLFLPSFASPEELSASHAGMGKLTFSAGQDSYAALNQVPLEQDVTMSIFFPWGITDTYPLRLIQCSANQTICIQTKDGTMAMIDGDQSKEADVAVTILDAQGNREYEGHAAISGRGNGTWAWPKKPYDLKFPEKISVGGFENLDKLCLLAEYVDTSKLRNALAYHAGQELDIPYASDYVYADVYIDGVYNGIYGLTTKREYTKHITADGIEAVFELSSSRKGREFYTDYHKGIRIHYGIQDQILYHVETFENALLDRDWTTVWQAADLESWARKYALDEFFYNYDLPLTSQYFYLDGDGIIKCMLPWDYEWIFYARMAPYDFDQERALAAFYSAGNWYEILLECEDFRLAVAKIWREEFTDSFLANMESYMDRCIQELTGSWHADRSRWNSTYAADPDTDGGLNAMTANALAFQSHFRTRLDFLLPLMENWQDHRLILFYTEKDGERYQTNLQLIVPAGTDIAGYYPQLTDSLYNLENQHPLSVTTEDGTPLESIGTITENLTVTVVY